MALRCDKRGFSSKQLATEAMMGMKMDKTKRSKHQPCAVYYCEGCQSWHVTSKKKKNYPVVTTSETKFKRETERQNADKSKTKVLVIRNYSSKPI